MSVPILCIAFDVDDTLYLERDYVRSGFNAVGRWVAATLGVKHFAENAWQLFEQGVRGSVFQVALEKLGREPKIGMISEMVEIYRNHQPEISLLPDASECLRRLRARAILGIITDGPPASQVAKCRKLRLDRFCEFMVFTGRWGARFYKPHPRAFELVQTEIGSGEVDFVYVGDNPSKDFGAPLSLGWNTVRVRRSEGLHFEKDALPDVRPRVEIRDLSALANVLSADRRRAL